MAWARRSYLGVSVVAALGAMGAVASVGATPAHAVCLARFAASSTDVSNSGRVPECGPPPCNPTITAPTTLPDASENATYSYKVPGCGTVTVTSGSLPHGLSFGNGTNIISGSTAGDAIQTAALTLKMTSNDQSVSENVELPVTKTYKVDSNGGELTGATNDGTLVYVAGSTAGDVFDLDTANPPAGSGTALTGLNFPAAVATTDGYLWVAQFGAAESALAPVAFGPAPSSTSSGSSTAASIGDYDSSCAKPDGVAATAPNGGNFGVAYSCAGSNWVQEDVFSPNSRGTVVQLSLGADGVPSGIQYVDGSVDFVVADARNSTLSLVYNKVIATVSLPAGAEPANVAYDASNGIAYVADPGTGQVSEVSVNASAGTLTDTGEIKVGSRPYGVAVNGAGNELVVTNSGNNTADVISLSGTPTISYAPTVGTTPDGVTIVGSEAYIADEQGGTVTVIDPPSKGLRKKLTVTHVHRGKHHAKKSKKHKKSKHGKPHSAKMRARLAVAQQVSIDPLVAPLPDATR